MFPIQLPHELFKLFFDPEQGLFRGDNGIWALVIVSLAYVLASWISARTGMAVERVVCWAGRKSWAGVRRVFGRGKVVSLSEQIAAGKWKVSPLCQQIVLALEGKCRRDDSPQGDEVAGQIICLFIGNGRDDDGVELILHKGQLHSVYLDETDVFSKLSKKDRSCLLTLAGREVKRLDDEETAALVWKAYEKNFPQPVAKIDTVVGQDGRSIWAPDGNGGWVITAIDERHTGPMILPPGVKVTVGPATIGGSMPTTTSGNNSPGGCGSCGGTTTTTTSHHAGSPTTTTVNPSTPPVDPDRQGRSILAAPGKEANGPKDDGQQPRPVQGRGPVGLNADAMKAALDRMRAQRTARIIADTEQKLANPNN